MSSPAAGENRLTRIPARTRARDTRATDSVFGSCVILRNSAVAGNRPESPAGIYINPGGLEGFRVRINRFIPIPIVVRIWHLTVVHVHTRICQKCYITRMHCSAAVEIVQGNREIAVWSRATPNLITRMHGSPAVQIQRVACRGNDKIHI